MQQKYSVKVWIDGDKSPAFKALYLAEPMQFDEVASRAMVDIEDDTILSIPLMHEKRDIVMHVQYVGALAWFTYNLKPKLVFFANRIDPGPSDDALQAQLAKNVEPVVKVEARRESPEKPGNALLVAARLEEVEFTPNPNVPFAKTKPWSDHTGSSDTEF